MNRQPPMGWSFLIGESKQMRISTLFIALALSAFNLTATNCLANPFQSSKLPKDMPKNTVMRFSENGGMAPSWFRVEISENQILVEDKDMQMEKTDKWYSKITEAEKRSRLQNLRRK
jgi:hypothetical protein